MQRYRKRLITAKHVFDMSNSLNLESFKALMQIADEKEQPIFRSEETDKVLYYIIDENRIYLYTADNSTIPPHDLKSKFSYPEVVTQLMLNKAKPYFSPKIQVGEYQIIYIYRYISLGWML
jgi:hypothetical protein